MQTKPLTINIIATFSSHALTAPLKYLTETLGLATQINIAPYNQLFQQLIAPDSLIFAGEAYNILLIRIEDWFKYKTSELDVKTLEATVDYFLTGLHAAAKRTTLPIILSILPVDPAAAIASVTHLNAKIKNSIAESSNIQLVDLAELETRYKIKVKFDKTRDKLGHVPFGQDYFSAMALQLVRIIYQRVATPYKVIAIDCDNTLWQGICGEDGALQVTINAGFVDLQKKLIQLQQAGKIICLCSKNNADDVWQVFENNAGMLLKRKHITAHKINWENKSLNLLALAKELNLSLDSFIFIDDNPLECAEVASALPEVLVINLANAAEISGVIANHWAMDSEAITSEDSKRTEMYLQNHARELLRNTTVDYETFLAKLQLNIMIQFLEPNEIPRAAQLTQKTNQFNSTTIRRDASQITALMNSSDWCIFQISVSDYFGDYGFVGLLIVEFANSQLICDSFILSCRILGRRVEHALLRHLADFAKERNLDKINLKFTPSTKNLPVKLFFQKFTSDETMQDIVIAVDAIDTLLAIPESPVPANPQPISLQPNKSDNTLHAALNLFAGWRGEMELFSKAMQAGENSHAVNYQAPVTPWQRKIANLFSEILSVSKVGLNDNFYELGGNLAHAQLLQSRLAFYGIPETISITTLFEPTVAVLARMIEEFKLDKHA